MVALAITESQVQLAAGTRVETYTAGAAIAVGQPVAIVNGQAAVATNDDTAALATVRGIAICAAEGSGQKVSIAVPGGRVTLGAGAAPVVGTPYFLGAAGTIVPLSDLVSTDYVTILGVGAASNAMTLVCHASGQQVP